MEIQKLNKDFIPEDLSPEEVEVWNKLAPQLIELEIINSLNYLILSRYCSLAVLNIQLTKKYPNNTQGIRLRNQELKKMEEELCLTPQAYNKWMKDRLIISERKKKQEKGNNNRNIDEDDEKFFG